MAVVPVRVVDLGDGVTSVTWEGLADGDTGEPVKLAGFADKTVQAVGNATSVEMEGSNDGETWGAIHNPAATEVSLTSGDIEVLLDNPLFIRPSATGGTDTDVIVIAVTER